MTIEFIKTVMSLGTSFVNNFSRLMCKIHLYTTVIAFDSGSNNSVKIKGIFRN